MEAVVRPQEDVAVTGFWTKLAARPVRFAGWLFGPLRPDLELVLMLLALGWAVLEVLKPQLFDTGAFVGMRWVSDPVWFGLHVVLAGLHWLGLTRLHWRTLRIGAAFLSSWQWLLVAVSLLRVEWTTGVIAYGVIGVWALFGGVQLAGLPRKAG